MWYIIGMVAAASGLTGVLFLSICVTSGVIIRRKSGIIHNTMSLLGMTQPTFDLSSVHNECNVHALHSNIKND